MNPTELSHDNGILVAIGTNVLESQGKCVDLKQGLQDRYLRHICGDKHFPEKFQLFGGIFS